MVTIVFVFIYKLPTEAAGALSVCLTSTSSIVISEYKIVAEKIRTILPAVFTYILTCQFK